MGPHGAGRHVGCSGEGLYTSHPQDKSSESEDNKNSESEEDSTEEESDEEDRDGDVDPGFREQLMAVLQAGKALVSHSWGARPVCVHVPTRPGCSRRLPSGWRGRRRRRGGAGG